MFTIFRFMLGDYSTAGGKSVLLSLSDGYGRRFDIFFVTFMVITVFGMFNIITAIFVESTVSGLKHNDTKRKYERQYERNFVRHRLEQLLQRVQVLLQLRATQTESSDLTVEDFTLNEDCFMSIIEDPIVIEIMEDLDISIFNPVGMFDTFDPDGNGTVTMTDFVQAIMKLRGEPHKNDVIACFLALRALQDRLDNLSVLVKAHFAGVPALGRPVTAVSRTATFNQWLAAACDQAPALATEEASRGEAATKL